MQTNTLDEFLDQYIEGYLFADLESVRSEVPIESHPGNAAYLMLAGVCSGIEFLGYLLRDPAKRDTNPSFDYYCTKYLAQLDVRYAAFGDIGRGLIRNGIDHSFATKGRVAITRLGDRETSHLVRYTDGGIIVVNPGFLFEDFRDSYHKFAMPDLSKGGTCRGWAEQNYKVLKTQYAKDIKNALQQAGKKLENWPWLQRAVPYTPGMSEIIEENGDLLLVS